MSCQTWHSIVRRNVWFIISGVVHLNLYFSSASSVHIQTVVFIWTNFKCNTFAQKAGPFEIHLTDNNTHLANHCFRRLSSLLPFHRENRYSKALPHHKLHKAGSCLPIVPYYCDSPAPSVGK